MGRLQRLDTQDIPESVLAPTDSSNIPRALERLRALEETWEQEEQDVRDQEQIRGRRLESATPDVLRVYDDVLTRVSSVRRSLAKLTQQTGGKEHPAETEQYLLALVTFAREYLSATKDEELAQECYDTRQRLSIELLTALEDFS